MQWALLSGLTEAERDEVVALGRRRSFARNEVVCHLGDPADSFHLVERGRLGVKVALPSGDEAMINVLGPGGSFGELALVRADGHRTATIVALEEATTLAVPGSTFRMLCRRKPEFQAAVTEMLADRVDELSRLLLEGMYFTFDRRLQLCLTRLAAAYGSGAGTVSIPLTQSQLAAMTGGTRPTVNLALQKLSEQGIVRLTRGRIEITDLRRLQAKVRT
ncbi:MULTISPECIES: Crp/Fnr family transcriptional regulator [Nocardioides]|uniref:Crp/Fnr family transcriptional regulator n=1 Tax=Nocardioides vastitatis TaxID=2568655 RepID=A0ABW0ZJ84_9ACTN|nr:Crp/Fnr family transcriptional regulator [Nocardioides sp.]THJ07387.1 Crp/Fnr family transcriptional regulator [Nocardioides sp.]